MASELQAAQGPRVLHAAEAVEAGLLVLPQMAVLNFRQALRVVLQVVEEKALQVGLRTEAEAAACVSTSVAIV